MTQPNILLIVSDDHGYGDISMKGSTSDVHTPNLDRLAATGIFFDNAYVTAPICSPSRAGLITGAHQQRWGAYWFNDANFAPQPRQSMAEILKSAGYRTGYFGKIHYGNADDYGDRSCPDQHGFEESFYGISSLSMGRLHYMKHGDEEIAKVDPLVAKATGVQPMVENGQKVSCHNHLTQEFTQRALQFIEAKDERPFFCMVAFNAVHNFTWQLPECELDKRGLPKHPDFGEETNDYLDWYDGAISPNLEHGRKYYLAQLEIMDREIGRLLDNLEDRGLRDNTIVVYLTDNGGSSCNYGNNAPLSGAKYTLMEGGIRVPYIVSYPAMTPNDMRSNQMVSSLDLLPTFAELAGADIPEGQEVDGCSLIPLLRGEDIPVHEVLHFDTGFQWAVRTKDWKLRYVDPDSPLRTHLQNVEHCDIGSGFMLTEIGKTVDESEAANQAADHPEIVAVLAQLHSQWRDSIAS